MKKQAGFGIISMIIVLAITAIIGWVVISRAVNTGSEETPAETIDRAKENIDKANEASDKAKDAIEGTEEILNSL